MYVRSQMYHIVKDAPSLTTMSSGKLRLGLPGISQRVSLFRTQRFKPPKFGHLTYFTFLRDIVNIAKNTQVIFMGSDKKEGIFLSVDPFKEKYKK